MSLINFAAIFNRSAIYWVIWRQMKSAFSAMHEVTLKDSILPLQCFIDYRCLEISIRDDELSLYTFIPDDFADKDPHRMCSTVYLAIVNLYHLVGYSAQDLNRKELSH